MRRCHGRVDDARRLVDRAIEYSAGQQGVMAHALRLRGDIATHTDSFDARAGEAHYRHALALAEPRGMRPLVAHCNLGLGKLYRRTGDGANANEHLINAVSLYRVMAMGFWLKQAETEMRSLGWARNATSRRHGVRCQLIELGARDLRQASAFGPSRTWRDVRLESAKRCIADTG